MVFIVVLNDCNQKLKLSFLIFVIIILSSCWFPDKTHKEQKAEADISMFLTAIQLYKKDNSSFPGFSASKNNDYRVKNEYLLEILSNNIKEGPYLTAEKPLTDPWNNPYQFWFDGNGDKKVLIDNKIIVETPIAIWSFGENGVDDKCSGDDITSW